MLNQITDKFGLYYEQMIGGISLLDTIQDRELLMKVGHHGTYLGVMMINILKYCHDERYLGVAIIKSTYVSY